MQVVCEGLHVVVDEWGRRTRGEGVKRGGERWGGNATESFSMRAGSRHRVGGRQWGGKEGLQGSRVKSLPIDNP